MVLGKSAFESGATLAAMLATVDRIHAEPFLAVDDSKDTDLLRMRRLELGIV